MYRHVPKPELGNERNGTQSVLIPHSHAGAWERVGLGGMDKLRLLCQFE